MIWIGLVLGVYLVCLIGIAWFSLHPPRIPIFVSPGAMGAPQEEVQFDSGGIPLRGWWVEAADAKCVMILAHGYMMNRSELSPLAGQLWNRGISSLVFDFRAHGRSGGKQSYLGYREADDVKAAVAYVRARCPKAKVGILGSSMGSAAAAIACGDSPGLADVLVLDSAYSRLSSAVLGWWRFLGGQTLAALLSPTVVLAAPLAGFNPFKVDVAQSLAKAGCMPILVIHGDADTLALPSEARRNFEACQGEKEIVWFERMGHSEGRWIMPERYHAALFAFLKRHGFC